MQYETTRNDAVVYVLIITQAQMQQFIVISTNTDYRKTRLDYDKKLSLGAAQDTNKIF